MKSKFQFSRNQIHSFLLIFILLIPSMVFSPKAVIRDLYPFLILMGFINSWSLFLWLILPIVIFIPGALFFWWTFNAPMNTSFWLIMMGTNLIETSDYLKTNALVPLAVGLLMIPLWIYFYRNLKGPIFGKKARLVCCAFILVPIIHVSKRLDAPGAEMNHHFTESYPWNMAISLQAALAEMKNYSQLHMTGEENLQVLKQDDTPQTVVLVIGESARRDRHQVYGAKVLNTPIMKSLEARNELDVFTDIITLHPHTVASVPVMLTKQKGLQGDNELVPSFVQVFKKAGYKVFWISNQASLGGSENRIGYYARTADVSHFFHIHNSNLPLAYDEEILSYFKNTFQDPAPKKLYVLHLQGSHYGFARRYPYSFSKFSDPYDNTLLYTDYLLGQFIETLKTEHKPDSLVYLSDHGLLLNECGREFTHFDNKQAFEIPFYVWTSPEWRKAHADLYQNLVKNKGARGSTQIVFDTLVDLGGISYNQYQPELSALNPKMSVGSRQVRTYDKLVDYDHSQNDKNCHLQELKY